MASTTIGLIHARKTNAEKKQIIRDHKLKIRGHKPLGGLCTQLVLFIGLVTITFNSWTPFHWHYIVGIAKRKDAYKSSKQRTLAEVKNSCSRDYTKKHFRSY
jgi:hypothetical protein